MKKLLLLSLLFTQPALAVIYTNNIENGCVPSIIRPIDNVANMTARWSVNSHVCNTNEFLPANIDSCVSCPMGQTCTGGTFDFNETETQGITYTTPIMYNQNNSCVYELLKPISGETYMVAKFVRNIHNCEPGYYLPANVDECTICPQNNKCVGGTYKFNETVNQGIEQCVNTTSFAPVGSTICYPHVLHIDNDVIYLKSTKLTTPSLNVGMDDGIFYANMTTVPTTMNNATERYLKIEYDGVVYYVCDDTTYNQ